MALGYKAKRRWALVLLLVGLPVYIILAVGLTARLPRPNLLVELLIYVGLGLLWALPFKYIFRGVGRGAPDEDDD